jgi:predicted flap endonuclease-1-like 5' DNA nuclease
MGLLDKIKSFLGQDDAGQPAPGHESAGAEGRTNVTVEREPTATVESRADVETEATVKGVETATESTPKADEPDTGSDDSAGDAETTGESDPVDSIKGIGSAYAERLADAEVGTVADLLTADLERVADEADISQSRLETWQERARE